MGAAVGSLGLAAAWTTWVWEDFFVWWGRNIAGSLVATTLGILVLGVALRAARTDGERWTRRPWHGVRCASGASRPRCWVW